MGDNPMENKLTLPVILCLSILVNQPETGEQASKSQLNRNLI